MYKYQHYIPITHRSLTVLAEQAALLDEHEGFKNKKSVLLGLFQDLKEK